MTGVAVKVTEVPEQIVVALAEIVTEGTTPGFTVMVMELEVTMPGLAQLAVDVITQLT